MKTKELIRQLQEVDPSGEIECCINNADIYFVNTEPAYYDGCLQVLKRDNNNKYYNIIGAKYSSKGEKVVIRPLSISDAVWEQGDLPVEFEGLNPEREAGYKERLNKIRLETIKINNDIERECFVKYLQKRFVNESGDFEEDEIKKLAIEFYDKNLDYKDIMPEDIAKMKTKQKIRGEFSGEEIEVGLSWHERRCKQWDREIAVDINKDGNLVLRRAVMKTHGEMHNGEMKQKCGRFKSLCDWQRKCKQLEEELSLANLDRQLLGKNCDSFRQRAEAAEAKVRELTAKPVLYSRDCE